MNVVFVASPRPMQTVSPVGKSLDAATVRGKVDSARNLTGTSLSSGKQWMFCKLYEIFEEGSQENWDGFGAKRISFESFSYAHRFLTDIPSTITLPEASAYPTGEVVLEWYRNPQRQLSICFQANGELAYAGALGTRFSGTANYSDAIPEELLSWISRIC